MRLRTRHQVGIIFVVEDFLTLVQLPYTMPSGPSSTRHTAISSEGLEIFTMRVPLLNLDEPHVAADWVHPIRAVQVAREEGRGSRATGGPRAASLRDTRVTPVEGLVTELGLARSFAFLCTVLPLLHRTQPAQPSRCSAAEHESVRQHSTRELTPRRY
jgi:hypothetical protein